MENLEGEVEVSESRGKMKAARNSYGADIVIARSNVSGVPRARP